MPKSYIVEGSNLDVIRKSMLVLAGDDAAKVEAVNKAFASVKKNEVPVEEPEDPLAKLFTGLYDAVDEVVKAGGTDDDLADVFEKAYGFASEIVNENATLAFAAASAEFDKRGKFPPAKKDGEEPDDEDEDCGDEMEKFLKGISPAGREFVSTLMKSNEDLLKRVGSMEQKSEDETLAKMAAEAGEGAPFAAILKKLPAADRVELVKNTKAKNDLIIKSSGFTEVGSGGAGTGGSALAQINAQAEELVKKGDPKTNTIQKAFTKVCADNPALYLQLKQETR